MFNIYNDTYFEISELNTNKEDFELFNRLNLVLELMNNGNFELLSGDINNNRILYEIRTKYPYSLPNEIAEMFFNINIQYKVNISEANCINDSENRYYNISIKKY